PFSSAVRTKANAPNKSGRLLETTISVFSHSLNWRPFVLPGAISQPIDVEQKVLNLGPSIPKLSINLSLMTGGTKSKSL
ncbi:hypothetical protein, partial [Pseudomonas sp. NPDC087614]|uniref:hypothetical protein n=1 Tax=Pseudomonas sp. NPDC087614 TaxID=3364442 RepID=UPI0037FA6806